MKCVSGQNLVIQRTLARHYFNWAILSSSIIMIFFFSLLPTTLARLCQISATVMMAVPMLEFLSGKKALSWFMANRPFLLHVSHDDILSFPSLTLRTKSNSVPWEVTWGPSLEGSGHGVIMCRGPDMEPLRGGSRHGPYTSLTSYGLI